MYVGVGCVCQLQIVYVCLACGGFPPKPCTGAGSAPGTCYWTFVRQTLCMPTLVLFIILGPPYLQSPNPGYATAQNHTCLLLTDFTTISQQAASAAVVAVH